MATQKERESAKFHVTNVIKNRPVKPGPIKPDHYKAGEFDVIAFCEYHEVGFTLGNVIKYVIRAGKKDPTKELEDLEKAKEYLERKIEKVKADQK